MSLGDLGILYVIAGAALAFAVLRRSPSRDAAAWASAAVTIPLWPLWAPVALTAARGRRPVASPPTTDAARRIEAALREGVEACAGSALSALLSAEAARSILAEVAGTEARRTELDALLSRPAFDRESVRARLTELERASSPPRALATARLHVENVDRLHDLRERDRRALEEVADLVEALRTQLVLARYAGSSVEGVGGIVSEVWARVEGLGAAMEESGATQGIEDS